MQTKEGDGAWERNRKLKHQCDGQRDRLCWWRRDCQQGNRREERPTSNEGINEESDLRTVCSVGLGDATNKSQRKEGRETGRQRDRPMIDSPRYFPIVKHATCCSQALWSVLPQPLMVCSSTAHRLQREAHWITGKGEATIPRRSFLDVRMRCESSFTSGHLKHNLHILDL